MLVGQQSYESGLATRDYIEPSNASVASRPFFIPRSPEHGNMVLHLFIIIIFVAITSLIIILQSKMLGH